MFFQEEGSLLNELEVLIYNKSVAVRLVMLARADVFIIWSYYKTKIKLQIF